MRLPTIVILSTMMCSIVSGQDKPKPEPDTLMLNSGEKLVGHLVRSSGGSVKFRSDALGEVNVGWDKIKELRAGGQYAVIPKHITLSRKAKPNVPEGSVTESEQKITIADASGAKTVAVADTDMVIEKPAFDKAMSGEPGLLHAWAGTVTAGASFVEATQNSRTFNDAITLVRVVPGEDWLARRNRTTIDFSSSYGLVSQKGSPTLKTSIYHADAERDEYFSPRLFGYAQALFDHSFSQGLQLQQTYVGGVGWSVISNAKQSLDLKGGVSYISQQFSGVAATSLAGSAFSDKYVRHLKKAVFTQTLAINPSWTNSKALSGIFTASLAVPVIRKFSLTLGASDNYLDNPPSGFKRNSLQFTTGLTYVLP